jgi:hypothetical protein
MSLTARELNAAHLDLIEHHLKNSLGKDIAWVRRRDPELFKAIQRAHQRQRQLRIVSPKKSRERSGRLPFQQRGDVEFMRKQFLAVEAEEKRLRAEIPKDLRSLKESLPVTPEPQQINTIKKSAHACGRCGGRRSKYDYFCSNCLIQSLEVNAQQRVQNLKGSY